MTTGNNGHRTSCTFHKGLAIRRLSRRNMPTDICFNSLNSGAVISQKCRHETFAARSVKPIRKPQTRKEANIFSFAFSPRIFRGPMHSYLSRLIVLVSFAARCARTKAEQSKTKQSRAKQNKAEQNRAKQTMQSIAMQNKAKTQG